MRLGQHGTPLPDVEEPAAIGGDWMVIIVAVLCSMLVQVFA